jgi:hypothetical protein
LQEPKVSREEREGERKGVKCNNMATRPLATCTGGFAFQIQPASTEALVPAGLESMAFNFIGIRSQSVSQ